MATVAESPDSNPPPPPPPAEQSITAHNLKTFDETAPWVDYAIHQAALYQKTVQEAVESTYQASKSRVSQILSTSSAHFQMTLGALQDVLSDYAAYEDFLFTKVKEGVNIAASHPMATLGVTTAAGFVVLKGPRHFLYNNTLRLFVSEEALLAKANAKVEELRQSIDLLKAESEKLEKMAAHAEEELLRGRTKLRHAGKQIQNVIHSAYKIERQAGGLKEILGELPRREASRFQSQVSQLVSEAKKERNVLTKEVAKISNYGISV